MDELIGAFERRDIDKLVGRVLRDLGNPEPPLRLEDVRSVLSLDLQYYRSSDPHLLQELSHRFTLLAKKTLPDVGKHLLAALSKSQLCAFWVPESARILVDSDVPQPKHRWIEAHEIAHSITPWHKDFLLGDNQHTIDPACRAMLESEANFGAGKLLFLSGKFASEALDLELSFPSIKLLSNRYSNSIVSTFWRMVEERDPTASVFGMVSTHPLHADVGCHDGNHPWRYFIRSKMFRTQFSSICPDEVYGLISRHATYRRTGPVFSARDYLKDGVGVDWEFQIESFSTKHALLTLGYPLKPRATAVLV